jgi:hypothetical protein
MVGTSGFGFRMLDHRHRLVVALLSLNLAALVLLACILFRNAEITPAAMAQVPSAETASVPYVVVPGQLAQNAWGCYVLDTKTQSLCIYQYSPGEKLLRLAAARHIAHDMGLKSFNTMPLPSEVAEMLQTERRLQSGLPATSPSRPTEPGRK